MIAEVEINHPRIEWYSKKQLEEFIEKIVYNYLEENDWIDWKFYPMNYDELSEEWKKKFDLLDTMTDEEIEKKYVNFSL